MRHSQISVDFIIILVILLAIFLFIFSASAKRTGELYGSQKFLSAKEIADKAAFSINNVFLAGNSVSQSFYLPEGLRDNTPYTITIYPEKHAVEIRWDDRQYTATLLTADITGVLSPAYGPITITNNLGVINIS